MFDLDSSRRLVDRELGAVIDRAERLDEARWSAPIAWLPGWTVGDLVDHMGLAASQQAEAFENLVAGRDDIPAYPRTTGGDPAAVRSGLVDGRARLVAALGDVQPDHLSGATPLPFGLVPTPVALQVAVLEYAYHHWDLEEAVNQDAYDLPADIALHGFEFLGGLLPMLSAGGNEPATPLAFVLRAPEATLVLEHDGSGWQPGESPTTDAVCEIRGDTGSLALFGMGRLDSGDARLTVSGPCTAEAKSFTDYFPGP